MASKNNELNLNVEVNIVMSTEKEQAPAPEAADRQPLTTVDFLESTPANAAVDNAAASLLEAPAAADAPNLELQLGFPPFPAATENGAQATNHLNHVELGSYHDFISLSDLDSDEDEDEAVPAITPPPAQPANPNDIDGSENAFQMGYPPAFALVPVQILGSTFQPPYVMPDWSLGPDMAWGIPLFYPAYDHYVYPGYPLLFLHPVYPASGQAAGNQDQPSMTSEVRYDGANSSMQPARSVLEQQPLSSGLNEQNQTERDIQPAGRNPRPSSPAHLGSNGVGELQNQALIDLPPLTETMMTEIETMLREYFERYEQENRGLPQQDQKVQGNGSDKK